VCELVRPVVPGVNSGAFTNRVHGLLAHMPVSTTQVFSDVVSVDCVATYYRAEHFQWRDIKTPTALTVADYGNILGHNAI
jgi:hypothetical protein